MQDPLLWPTATDEFLTWGRDTNRFHGATPISYNKALKSLQLRYPDEPVSRVMTVDSILEFLRTDATGKPRTVGQPGWTENTVDLHLRAFKSFSRFGSRVGYCPDLRDALAEAFNLKVRTRRKAIWLGPDDIRAIADACPADASGVRDRHLILVGALTGLRRAEMGQANWSHLDLRGGTLWVPKGKGDKERYIGLVPRAIEVLGEWRETCAKALGAVPTLHPIFPTIGKLGDESYLWWDRPAKAWYRQTTPHTTPYWPMGYFAIQTRVTAAGSRAGIEGLAPHDLRRTFAGILEDAGLPVQKISAQLGHSSVDTTIRYLDSNPRRRADALAGIQVAF